MKRLYAVALYLLNSAVLAQSTNYIANVANSDSPGTYNTLVGGGAGISLTNTSFNVFVGANAGRANTQGDENTYLGALAGYTNTTGWGGTFVGNTAGYNNSTGRFNTFLGNRAGNRNTIGENNTFVGSSTGYTNTTGINNTFVGSSSGSNNTAGDQNTFLGVGAGFSNSTGFNNTFLGHDSGFYNTTGSNNIFLGLEAGFHVTTGSKNIIIGPNSGTAITDGNDNVLMGYNSQAEDGLQNAIAIGSNSRVAISNALILGNQVNVGIGTFAPANRLQIVSEYPNTSGLTLTNLTDKSPTTQTTDQFLTVSETGEVVKARYQLRIKNADEWSDKVFSPAYPLRSIATVDAYIQHHGHLPGIPSAEQVVKEGIDLVRLNASLLEKVEELTLYSIELEKTNQHQEAKIDQLEKQYKQEIADLKKLVNQLLKQQ